MHYESYKPQTGDIVRFTGWTKEQVAWGNNATPHMLTLNHNYVIESVDVHRYHTKVTLRGVDKTMKFNSVHFEFIKHDDTPTY